MQHDIYSGYPNFDFIKDSSKELHQGLVRGIDCGLLMKTLEASLHRMDISGEQEGLTMEALVQAIDASYLKDNKSALINFYRAARFLLGERMNNGINETYHFFESLDPIENFDSPEWKNIESSESYKRVQKIVRAVIAINEKTAYRVTSFNIDTYLETARRALQSKILRIDEMNDAPSRLKYLYTITRAFVDEISIHYCEQKKAVANLIKRLTLGVELGIVDLRAQGLKTAAEGCFVNGELPKNWLESNAAKTLIAQKDAL